MPCSTASPPGPASPGKSSADWGWVQHMRNGYNISPSRYIHTGDAKTTGSVTNRQIQDQFKVVKDTALRDLTILCELNLLKKKGQGRSTRYVHQTDKP